VQRFGQEYGEQMVGKIVIETGDPYPQRDGAMAKAVQSSNLGTGVWRRVGCQELNSFAASTAFAIKRWQKRPTAPSRVLAFLWQAMMRKHSK
jgi:hypothetical protein